MICIPSVLLELKDEQILVFLIKSLLKFSHERIMLYVPLLQVGQGTLPVLRRSFGKTVVLVPSEFRFLFFSEFAQRRHKRQLLDGQIHGASNKGINYSSDCTENSFDQNITNP